MKPLLAGVAQLRQSTADPAAPQLVEMDCNIGVKGEGFEYIFGRSKGLVSIRYNGVQLLDDTVRPNFWRAPTNNDEAVQSLRVCLLEDRRSLRPVR